MKFLETLGDRLRLARQKAGLKQMQVKERTRIHNKTLSGYENGVSEPDLNTLTILADLYGVSLQWLSTGKVDVKGNQKSVDSKEDRDIAKRLKQFEADLANSDGLAFDGEPMSDEAKESLLESMELLFRQTQRINKKYTPKKYRDD